jgi:predicted phage tail component-like protein
MFSFDGIHVNVLGINVNYPTISAMPQLTNLFEEIDGKDGLVDFGSQFKEKYITFNCNFKPQYTFEEAIVIIDNFNKYLNPKLGLKSLILDVTPDRQYQARLYQGIDVQRLIRTGGQFEITFVIPNPYAYGLTLNNEQYTSNGTYTFDVGGNATALPLLTIIADIQQGGDNLIFNFNNLQVLEVRPVVETTYRLEVDCENRTIKYILISTEEEFNGLPYIEKIAFPELLNGENSLEITESSIYTTITSIDIDWYDRYI